MKSLYTILTGKKLCIRGITPYVLAFSLGAIYRAIPELLIPIYPAGFETIAYYAPEIIKLRHEGILIALKHLTNGLTFYLLMWIVVRLINVPTFTILKIAGPILYGLLASSYMFFLKNGLSFDKKTSLMATFVCISLPICLRIGWDRFVNMSGLIPMFLALGLLGRKRKTTKQWCIIAFLLLLATLSRELIASVVLAALTGYSILTKEEKKNLIPILASYYAVFFIMILPYLGIHYFSQDERFLPLPNPAKETCPLPILVNYFPEGFSLNSYIKLCKRVLTLFTYAYAPTAPFLIKGTFRDRIIDFMLIWLLIGGIINPLMFPFASIPYFQRWQTLLVFPFCAYLANSLNKLGRARARLLKGLNNKLLILVVILYITLGSLYSSGLISLESEWTPPNLVQSSIGIDQIDDCIACIKWLDNNAMSGACLIIEERFRGWVLIYMKREDIKIAVYEAPGTELGVDISNGFKRAYNEAIEAGFETIYFIWYSGTRINGFDEVYSYGSIAVYQAESKSVP